MSTALLNTNNAPQLNQYVILEQRCVYKKGSGKSQES
jgi:hypothetical protein